MYLATSRAGYWRMKKYLLPVRTDQNAAQRKIVAVIPARNEADVVGDCIRSLLTQELHRPLEIVLVDDGSTDRTADLALGAATNIGRGDALTVIRGAPLPDGWTGKLWAVSQGVKAAEALRPDYLLLTDADIAHGPGTVERLLELAEARAADLSSVMVQLRTATFAEKLLIPAFVYFFFQLYPPDWVSKSRSQTAGAAGGCMLIRTETLQRVGGIQAVAGEVIDDCALAALVKRHGGTLWMGLSSETVSLRSYGGFAGVGAMIARSAFNQLRHSNLSLALTLAGLLLTYIVPPALLFSRRKSRVLSGTAACLLMFTTYMPAIQLYRQRKITVLGLPLAALFYAGATLYSALRYWTGTGGEWKGRIQDRRTPAHQRFLLPPKSL